MQFWISVSTGMIVFIMTLIMLFVIMAFFLFWMYQFKMNNEMAAWRILVRTLLEKQGYSFPGDGCFGRPTGWWEAKKDEEKKEPAS